MMPITQTRLAEHLDAALAAIPALTAARLGHPDQAQRKSAIAIMAQALAARLDGDRHGRVRKRSVSMILFCDRTTNIMSLLLGRKQLQLVGGSPISEKELWACAAAILKRYGAVARDEVNCLIDKKDTDGDFAGHATRVNIALCLIALSLAAEDETKH